MDELNLGIKNLTLENWMNPDPLMRDLVMLNKKGTVSSMSGNDWASSFLEPKLVETIPIEILKLFEVARGSMLYGYFFYPLYTLAKEQLYRVAEAAVSEKCNQIVAPKSAKTFNQKLDYLYKKDVLSKQDYDQWNAIKQLRNISSHPEQQTIMTPGCVLDILCRLVDKINFLFAIS